SRIIQVACAVALTHHERWDGTGYPKGLKESAIPVSGRIATVADTYHALTSARPYRDSFWHAEALEALTAARRSRLDPAVLQTFLEGADRLPALRGRYPDSGDDAALRQFAEALDEPRLSIALLVSDAS